MSRRSETLTEFANETFIEINETDALKMEIKTKDKVKVSSVRGEIKTIAKVSNEVAEGEVFMPWHFNESKVNYLVRDELDPTSKIPAYKLTAVRIDKI